MPRYKLRTLLIVLTVIAMVVAFLAEQHRRQRALLLKQIQEDSIHPTP
jgi:hypothetical protein